MKKRDVLLLCLAVTFIILASNFALAQTNATAERTGFDKSDACLRSLIDQTNYSGMSVEQLAFSLLALAYDSSRQNALRAELISRKDPNNNCWPANACTVRDTALVMKAYDYVHADTAGIMSWLMNQTATPTELIWYLQIENPSNEQMRCTITYDGSGKTVTVNADKTISGSGGSCFSSANGYWLEVKSSCYQKNCSRLNRIAHHNDVFPDRSL